MKILSNNNNKNKRKIWEKAIISPIIATIIVIAIWIKIILDKLINPTLLIELRRINCFQGIAQSFLSLSL